jgi:hypothetical protein
MSIKSTKHISRQAAIERIKHIVALATDKEYKKVESICFEDYHTVENFINNFQQPTNVDYIDKWSNKMLEDLIDEPFYRESIFDNYIVED